VATEVAEKEFGSVSASAVQASLSSSYNKARCFPRGYLLGDHALGGGASVFLSSNLLPESASMYPQVGCEPGQRFSAKGSSIVRLMSEQKTQLLPLSDWIVP
jgi:hypothetical protein